MSEKRDYYVLCGEAKFLMKGVTRITRKGWLFTHEIVFWGDGELPLGAFRDEHVSAVIAWQDGMVWKQATDAC